MGGKEGIISCQIGSFNKNNQKTFAKINQPNQKLQSQNPKSARSWLGIKLILPFFATLKIFEMRFSVFLFFLAPRASAFQKMHHGSVKKTACTVMSAKATAAPSRQKQVSTLSAWEEANGIKSGGIAIEWMEDAGLGLVATQEVPSGTVVLNVPSSVTLSVETPSSGPDDFAVMDMVSDRRAFRDLPWYAQFALYLYKLDKVDSIKSDINLQPWLNTLPRSFSTPIHWETKDLDMLQYQHLSESVHRQKESWTDFYNKLKASSIGSLTWEDFLWGCECARSRAFSGGYTGTPFNSLTYVFTLVLVTVYVGLNLGSLEQAANGAALVFCGSVLRDFVLPKLFRTKKYVICPIIDMCNHNGLGTSANVAYEFFSDSYSLVATTQIGKEKEVHINYGSRSNDQLLQFYGFVEADNPHDVYVMPPLGEWDIAALERACGRSFPAGRLGKLERAGLLGRSPGAPTDDQADDSKGGGNPRGGVVLARASGIDLAVIQALRALVSTDEEWIAAGEAVGNFAAEVSPENETRARLAARTAVEMELYGKATTLEEDKELLKRATGSKAGMETEERTAIQFRIEKKKILRDTIEKLR